jgi:hypothetical protein
LNNGLATRIKIGCHPQPQGHSVLPDRVTRLPVDQTDSQPTTKAKKIGFVPHFSPGGRQPGPDRTDSRPKNPASGRETEKLVSFLYFSLSPPPGANLMHRLPT